MAKSLKKILLLMFFCLLMASAFSQQSPVFYERKDRLAKPDSSRFKYDYGTTTPKPDKNQTRLLPVGFTNDFEHILTAEQIARIDSLAVNFEKETGIEIAVVTIDSSVINKAGFEPFIIHLANEWGVGKKELHNGVLIGVSIGLRKIRISTGYGIVPKLPDNEVKKMIDEIMIPEFRQQNYYAGIEKVMQAIITILR